jgi:ubiquinol-cytochrome c reductase iron-sulfur subunit
MTGKTAARIIALCFLISMFAGVAFIVAYVLDWGNEVMGGVMSLGLAALSLGLVLWSVKLLPGGTFVEARAPLPAPRAERAALLETAARGSGSPKIVRRTLLLSLFGLFTAAVVPLRSLIRSNTVVPGRALSGTQWRKRPNQRMMTLEGDLILAADVPVGTMITVLPEGHPKAYYATVLLLRLAPHDLPLLPNRIQHGMVDGILALSKLCTHAGCPVGLYEQTSQQLFCPCHQSIFDVLAGAVPIAGPAARPLPQLPLGVDDAGYLVGVGDFSGQPGPTYWKSYWRPYVLGNSK